MKFKFEKLEVWHVAMEMGEVHYSLIKTFPEVEKFNLSSQLLRATDSIALNIAEGSIGQSNPEFRKFLAYSIRSLAEFVTCLHKAKNRDYLTRDKFDVLYQDCFKLMNKLNALKNSIK